MWTVRIKSHERGLLFKHGEYARFLRPGKIRLWSRLWSATRARVEIVDTLQTYFKHGLVDLLVRDETLRREIELVELNDLQRALVWRDDRLAFILGPGRHALWRTPYALRVELYDTRTPRFSHERIDAVLAHPQASQWLDGLVVESHEQAVLLRDGAVVDRLGPGRYVYWKQYGKLTWKGVDLREQVLDVAGQEIMTADKVTLRANLTVVYQVTDAARVVQTVPDHAQALYREAQLVLRAALGTRTLDALLADKSAIGGEIRQSLAERTAELGIVVRSAGLRDVILPGDMRDILNQVLAAEKQAQANLIKRREETAALRNQANSARLLAENPTLARLKELELLQEILSNARATYVVGRGDLLEQVTSLVRSPASPEA